jgi:hypothetical protein
LKKLTKVLANQVMQDGRKAPVILTGHGWDNYEQRLRKE